jgi:hypothetical protein
MSIRRVAVHCLHRVLVFSHLHILSGRLAQLVRAAALHAVGQGFESLVAHLTPRYKPVYSKQTKSYKWAFSCGNGLQTYCLV